MEKKSKRRSERSLPDEIITDILSRLPVESIMVCKCVCKSWNSLLTDNYFVKSHLARSQINTSSSHILFESKFTSCYGLSMILKRYLLNVDNHKIRNILAYPNLVNQSQRKKVEFGDMPVMSSLHGLICFSTRFSYSGDPVVVYNPLIRGDYVCLPDSKSDQGHRTATLGFDCSTNKYKVVKSLEFGYDRSDPSIHGCEVLTVGKDSSWRRVEFPYKKIKFYNRGTFHHGSIYWMIRGMDKCCILEFDLTKEVFSVFGFPSSIRSPTCRSWCRVQLHNLGEYLCLTERENRVVHIWQLVKQNAGTKFDGYRKMKIESPNKSAVTRGFIYLNNNEDLLLLQTHGGFEQSGSENGVIIKMPGTHYTIYRPDAASNKHVRLPTLQNLFTSAKDVHAWCFTPSLVSIKEAMSA